MKRGSSMKLSDLFINENITIKESIKKLDETAKKILIVTSGSKLKGIITDGDIRRWILKSGNLQESVRLIMNTSPKYIYEKDKGLMRLHILGIAQKHQNKGFAQMVMKRLEEMYPQIYVWELDTIKSEERNLHLYEKMGYIQTSEEEIINEKLTLVRYIKKE